MRSNINEMPKVEFLTENDEGYSGIRDFLSSMKAEQLSNFKLQYNFSKDEESVVDMLSKKKSIKEIAEKLNTSEATVSRRIKSIKQKMGGKMDMGIKQDIPIWVKLNLTIEEAAAYSNIGINKIAGLLKDPGCEFGLRVGPGKTLIKRKEFEKYLSKTEDIGNM